MRSGGCILARLSTIWRSASSGCGGHFPPSLLLATPQTGNTVEQLTGLLAASNARQGYTVQDDGAIAIPNVGRVQVSGMTLEEAENRLFQRLVENQIDPTFSLEVAEFNSKKVSIGGVVGQHWAIPLSSHQLKWGSALIALWARTVTSVRHGPVCASCGLIL